MQHAVGGDGANTAGLRKVEKGERIIVTFTREMPLHLDKCAIAAESGKQRVNSRGRGRQSAKPLQQIRLIEPRPPLSGGQARARSEETAEIPISADALHKKRRDPRGHGDFGPHNRTHAGFLRGLKETGGAGEAVAVDQTHGGVTQSDRLSHKVFGR